MKKILLTIVLLTITGLQAGGRSNNSGQRALGLLKQPAHQPYRQTRASSNQHKQSKKPGLSSACKAAFGTIKALNSKSRSSK